MRAILVAAVAQLLMASAHANHVTVQPTSVSVVLPSSGSKQVHVTVAFLPSPVGYSYNIFLSTDSQCLNPSPVFFVTIEGDEDSGLVPPQGEFADYWLEFDVNGFSPGSYSGNFCVSVEGSMILPEHDALPVNLEVSADALFVDGFDQ